MRNKSAEPLALYLHIPFCRQKCAYCDFYSFRPGSEELPERYVRALIRMLGNLPDRIRERPLSSVFFGGGTPTFLSADQLVRILDAVRDTFRILPDAEITSESNPGTGNFELYRVMRKAGFNRLSLGLQSADDAELRALSRIHTYGAFLEAFRDAREAGFDNLNVDLMYGLPGQTAESFQNTLDAVLSLHPEHLSVYGLMLEEGTPLWRDRASYRFPDEDAEADMYYLADRLLGGAGFDHYEISNYAKPGYRSRHNLTYWTCGDYLGLGPAAHSLIEGERFSFPPDADAFCAAAESDAALPHDRERLSETDRIAEYLMLGWRLGDGISSAAFEQRFGLSFDIYRDRLRPYLEAGLAERRGDRYAFTAKGMYVSNAILSDVIDFTDG